MGPRSLRNQRERASGQTSEGRCPGPPPNNPPETLSFLRGLRKRTLRAQTTEWWRANRPGSYSRLQVGPRVGAGPELSLKRKTLGKLVAARSQHGDFLAYKERFNYHD